MRRSTILASVFLMLLAACCVSVAAGDEPATTSTTSTEVSKTKDKADADKKAEEIRLEVERRNKVERDEHMERRGGRHRSDRYEVSAGDDDSLSGTLLGFLFEGVRTGDAGVVFAPGSGNKRPAYGVHWVGARGFGAAFWFSGAADRGASVINSPIPHTDYVNRDSHSSFALESLYSTGSGNLSLVFGAGLAIQWTYHTHVSNATGWRWNGGSDRAIKGVAQIGCRLQVSERAALSAGYDTLQHAYVGLTMGF